MILAKTIKGYGMGISGEGQMITHQAKKMTEDALLAFRDRFELPLTDEQVRARSSISPRMTRRRWSSCASAVLRSAASCPAAAATPRRSRSRARELRSQLEGTGEREVSTTMAFVRILAALLRDKAIGADRADRPRRVAHLRDGGHVPPVRHLRARAASSTSLRTPSS